MIKIHEENVGGLPIEWYKSEFHTSSESSPFHELRVFVLV